MISDEYFFFELHFIVFLDELYEKIYTAGLTPW